MANFRVGDEVDTPYGPGVVIEVQANGLRVQITKAMAIVRLDEWTVTPRQRTAPKPPQVPSIIVTSPIVQRDAGAKTGSEPAPAAPPAASTPMLMPIPKLMPTPTLTPTPTPTPSIAEKGERPPPPAVPVRAVPRRTPARPSDTRGSTRESDDRRRFTPIESARNRQAVEALRFGLVPTVWLKDLTIGFEELESWTTSLLSSSEEGRPVAAEISGPFGTGKSHACAVVRSIARERGYLVANVEVDGLRVSLSDPALLWNALCQTLHGHDLHSSTPVVDVYLRALNRGNEDLRTTWSATPGVKDAGQGNFELVRVLHAYGVAESVADLLENHLTINPQQLASETKRLIQGEVDVPPSLLIPMPVISRSPQRRSAEFVQAMIALALAGSMAGYSGLVISVDEFEVEYYLTRSKLVRMQELITELATYVAGRSDLVPAPIALFFASIGQDGHRGDALIDHLVSASGGRRYDLQPMDAQERRAVAERIHRLYVSTYALRASFDPEVAAEVETSLEQSGDLDSSGVARAFIKQYVAKLDRLHGPPDG